MFKLSAFCARGFFPKEFPPPFQSTILGKLAKQPKSFPNQFNDISLQSQTFRYSLARSGGIRRTLHVVNPVGYFILSRCIVTHWRTITKHIARSPIGLSYLTDTEDRERALKRFRELDQLPRERARRFAYYRYLFKADIERFFPSIYTHSISWALHTKQIAKRKRSDLTLLGNQLDKIIRNAQDQQTMGIPIGPDTSHVISEILLSTVDYELSKRYKLAGFRYVDDYELAFKNRSDAEKCGNELQSILADFELELSSQKTDVIDLPHEFDQTWVTELRAFPISRYSKSQHYHIMHFFNRAFELFHEDKTRNVLRYAVSRFRNVHISSRNWKEYQGILCQCMTAEPGTIKFAIDSLWSHAKQGSSLDIDLISNTLSSIIDYHAPLAQDSEVCWSLWTAILFSIKLDIKTIRPLLKSDQPCINLLLLDGIRKGLFSSKLDTTVLKGHMSKDELYGKYWLLTYENAVTQWLRTKQDYVKRDFRFGYLVQNGVRFYNENAASEYRPAKRPLIVYDVSA